MKNLLFLILFTLFISCSVNKAEAPIQEISKLQLDTFAIGNKIYTIQDLSDTNFVFQKFDFPDPSNSLMLIQYTMELFIKQSH